MVGTSTVTSKGQVTVPESVRMYLGIVPGDSLYFEVDPETNIARISKAPKSGVEELAGSMKSSVPFEGDMDVVRDKVWKEVGKMYDSRIYGKNKK